MPLSIIIGLGNEHDSKKLVELKEGLGKSIGNSTQTQHTIQNL